MSKFFLKIGIITCGIISIVMLFSFIIRLNSTPLNTKLSENTESRGYNNTIQLNILNATGKTGLASQTRDYLRQVGFDVVEIGNYDTELDTSIVIDRLGDKTSAFKLSRVVGINEKNIKTEIDSSLYLRATLVLGKDFKNLRLNL